MGKLNLLHHKSYHVYKAENVEKVRADEAKAALIEEEGDRRSTLADSEARIDRLRKKSKRKDRDGEGEGEKDLERQLKKTTREKEGGTRIMVASTSKVTDRATHESGGAHINFWEEFENGGATTSVHPDVLLKKALEKEEFSNLTKVYLGKKGESGWYDHQTNSKPSVDPKVIFKEEEKKRKEVERKDLNDPMMMMNAYLKRRADVISGSTSHSERKSKNHHERYPTAATNSSSEVTTNILPPRRDHRNNPSPISTTAKVSTRPTTLQSEASNRESLEAQRTAALLASRRRSSTTSTIDTPRSDYGGNFFNSAAMRELNEQRGGRSAGMGGVRNTGWGDMRQRREERTKRM